MASTEEKGHVVNIADFKRIIDGCEEFGVKYNPPNADITIASMTAKWTAVDGLHSDYNAGKMDAKLPINEREVLFDRLAGIVTRTINLYECTQASVQSKEDAKGLGRVITGSNVRKKKRKDGLPIEEWVSNSHLGFDMRTENFAQLLELYKADTNYFSNESDLTIGSLESLLADLKTATNKVDIANVHATQLRMERNHGLYDEGEGLVDVSLLCKKYVRALYGAKSPEAMSIVKIKLKRFMRTRRV